MKESQEKELIQGNFQKRGHYVAGVETKFFHLVTQRISLMVINIVRNAMNM